MATTYNRRKRVIN